MLRAMSLPALLLAAATAADSLGQGRGVADTVTVLPPVIVETARPHEPVRETATMTRLDRGRIARFQPLRVADALLTVPGLDLQRTGPWATRISLRGLSSERVMVLVDGVRLESGRGHGAQTSLVDVDRLEAVEVQPGASSAQYGSDALAGVVRMSTHRPLIGDVPGLALTLSSRMATPGDGYQEHARLRWIGRSAGAEVSGGLGRLGALVTPDARVANSGSHDEDLAARFAGRALGVTLDAEHTRHAARDIGLPAFTSSAGSHAEYPLQGRDVDRLELSAPVRDAWPAWSLLAVQQRFLTNFVETTVDSQFLRGRYVASRAARADDRITTRMRTFQPMLQRGPFALSGEWRTEWTSGPRETRTTITNAAGAVTADDVAPGESVPHARRDAWATALSSAFVRGPWRLELGSRYDALHSRADSTELSFTPKLDATDRRWSADAGLARAIGAWTPYARFSSGLRAPNLEERYFNDSFHGGMRLFGNPDLRAERSRTVELGVRVPDGVGPLAAMRLSVYRSDVRDLISLVYLGQLYLVPRFQYSNVDRARLEGVELEAGVHVGPTRLELSAAMPRGEDLATGARLTDVGAAKAIIEWRGATPRIPRLMWAARGRWQDAVRSNDPELARPAYWTTSTELSATVSDTRVALSVQNLFDTVYREPMSFIPEAGRTFVLTVRREQALPWLSAKRGTR